MNNLISVFGIALILMIGYLSFIEPSVPSARFIETIKPWPPVLEKAYPDLELQDQDGRKFKLSDYRGKVILLQFIGMNSPVCQAFSGSKKKGSFGNVLVAENIDPLEKMLKTHLKGKNLPNPDLVIIQIIFYNMRFQEPRLKDAAAWAKHFNLKTSENQIVAFSPYDLRSSVTFSLIPGFHLIDKNFILIADLTGVEPKESLEKTVLPMVPIALGSEKR